MTATWQITYQVTPGVPVVSPRPTYPDLALSLDYDHDGHLVSAVHTVQTEGSASDQHIVASSSSQLSLFWGVLSFRFGAPLDVHTLHARRIDLMPGVEVTFTPVHQVQASAVLTRSVELPRPERLQAAPGRLAAWFTLANLARDAETDVDAIRNYYMIIEDMHGAPTAHSPPDERSLKDVRDFVSHGAKLSRKSLLHFLATEFGHPVMHFDPTNPEHQNFIRRRRQLAHAFIHPLLDSLL